jgi:signal peptidase I
MRRVESASADAAAVKCELAGEVLRSFGNLRFEATGWSMLPSVWPGDTLMVDRVSGDQVHVGDVVLVGRDGRLCAHRVVSRSENKENPIWITQGDAMAAPDRPVTESELLGRVSYLVRAGRLIAVRPELSAVERLTAKIVGQSVPAARALVYLYHVNRRVIQTSARSAPKKPSAEKSVLPCQG